MAVFINNSVANKKVSCHQILFDVALSINHTGNPIVMFNHDKVTLSLMNVVVVLQFIFDYSHS